MENRSCSIQLGSASLNGTVPSFNSLNICTTKGQVRRRETWWWNDEVDRAIKVKRRLWKEWKAGGSKEQYLEAKRTAKSKVYAAKKKAEISSFQNSNCNVIKSLFKPLTAISFSKV